MSYKQGFAVIFGWWVGGCTVAAGDASDGTESVSRSENASCQNALSAAQEKTVLKLIDDICGDTWCEGDDDFAFERLTCRTAASTSPQAGTCTLKLRLIPRDDSGRSFARTCTTPGFSGFDSLVETAPSGYASLDWDYYLALTDCIDALEAELPSRSPP